MGRIIHSRRATSFDGLTEYVDLGDVLGFERTDAFSLACWINTTGAAGPYAVIAKLGESTAFPGYQLAILGDGTIRFDLISDFSTGSNYVRFDSSENGYNDGRWHLVVATYDGSSSLSGVNLYVDGRALTQGATNDNLSSSIATANALQIGARATTSARWIFDGLLDEPMIVAKELSQAEVLEIWNGGRPKDVRSLSFYGPSVLGGGGAWRGGDGDDTASTWFDVTGRNDGTTTGIDASNYVADVPFRSYLNVLSTTFDGINDTFSMGDAAELKFAHNDEFSVSFWAKWTATSGIAVSKMDTSSAGRGWYVAVGSGILQVVLRNDAAGGDLIQVDTVASSFNDGGWHHVVMTWNGTGSTVAANVTLYVDANDETLSATADSLTATIDTTAPFRISGRAAILDVPFTGDVCQVSMFDRALTQAEVTELYGRGPVDVAGTAAWGACVGYWHCGGGDTGAAGGTISATLDQTVHGNDGISAGSPVVGHDVPAGGGTFLYGLALDCGGTHYVDVGSEAEWDFAHTDAFSLECWFRFPDSSVPSDQALVAKWSATSAPGFRVYLDNQEDLIVDLRSGTGNAATVRTTSVAVGTLASSGPGWHHMAMTYDGSQAASGITLYLDGFAVGLSTVEDTLSATISNATALQWGAANAGGVFGGLLAGCAVYGVELTAAQVRNHFNGGTPVDLSLADAAADLQGWWPVGHGDRGDATVVVDQSTNLYPGILSGTGAGYGIYTDLDSPPPGSATWVGPSQDLVTEANLRGGPGTRIGGSLASRDRRLPIGALSAARSSLPTGKSPGPNENAKLPPAAAGQASVFFRMRGRDDGRPAPGFVTWTVRDEPDFDGSEATPSNTDPPLLGSVIPGTATVMNETRG